jgi:hypothetical protein
MMRFRTFGLVMMCAFICSAGCQGDEVQIDRTPLPAVAAPPYICGYIPLKAVELMTGVHDPLVRGDFDLTLAGGLGSGKCAVYQRDGSRLKVLAIGLLLNGSREVVEEAVQSGASPLPEIMPQGIGAYRKDSNSKTNAAYAMLVRGKASLGIDLDIGVKGRDNAADVVALMKLIAPKLITDASAPSASPSSSPRKAG